MVSFTKIDDYNVQIAKKDFQIKRINNLDNYLDVCLDFAKKTFDRYCNKIVRSCDSKVKIDGVTYKINFERSNQSSSIFAYTSSKNFTITIHENRLPCLSTLLEIPEKYSASFLIYHEIFHGIEFIENINLCDIYSITRNSIFCKNKSKVGLVSSREISANYFAYLMLEREKNERNSKRNN